MVVIFNEAERPAGNPPTQARRWPELGLARWLSSVRDILPFRAGAAKEARCRPATTSDRHHTPASKLTWEEQNAILREFEKNPVSATISSSALLDVARAGGAEADGCNISEIRKEGEDVAMDAEIWSALPEDIIEKVLAWLPLTSVLRFRAVCRQWNSVLLSGSFLSSHSKISLHRQPCFLLCTIGQFACTYDPSLGKWLTLLKPTSPGASVVASTGSLLCLGNQVSECKVLWVFNPITRAIRHLPAMCNLCLIHKITMLEDQSTNSYTIVVTGEDGPPMPNTHNFNLITEVFDSRVNAWHAASDPPSDANFGSDPGVWLDGAFYCLTELPYGIIKFCLEKEMWEEVTVAMPPSLSVASLATARDRLMMVGRCKVYAETEEAFTIHVWELVRRTKKVSRQEHAFNSEPEQDGDVVVVDNKGNVDTFNRGDQYEWIEVIKVPNSVSKEFLAPLTSYSPFVCVGVGSSIYITTHLSPRVLVLDCCFTASSTSDNHWSWLPQDPLFPIHRDLHLLGFSFEPRFNATP